MISEGVIEIFAEAKPLSAPISVYDVQSHMNIYNWGATLFSHKYNYNIKMCALSVKPFLT